MKRAVWTLGGCLVLFVVFQIGSASTHYSGVCVNCLQQVCGTDKTFFGFSYYCSQQMTRGGGGLMSPSIFGPKLSPADPHTYEEIFGKSCEHHFVRTGFCSYSFGMVGCGSYGGSRNHEFRLALIESLYQTFRRIPNRPLAQETYSLIERYSPIVQIKTTAVSSLQSVYAVDSLPNDPMSILYRGLAIILTESEWRVILEAAKTGDGKIELLTNKEVLIKRLKDSDLAGRVQAVNSLVALNTQDAWSALVDVLDDEEIGDHAANQILWNKQFEYFDQALRTELKKSGGNGFELMGLDDLGDRLSDQEIRTLLEQKKARVDSFCLKAIERTDRFQFLESVLTILNQRHSVEAIHTINRLIAGPHPDLFLDPQTKEPARSQWQALQDSRGDVLKDTYRARSQADRLLRQAMELGRSKRPTTWDEWQKVFEGWRSENATESFSAAFAEAMYTVDPDRTIKYLASEIQTATDRWGNSPSHVLTGMGAIGVPSFLPEIERFEKRSKGTNYDRNLYYRKFVDYAKHRCRQIHLWKLVASPENADKYVIVRPDGSSIQ